MSDLENPILTFPISQYSHCWKLKLCIKWEKTREIAAKCWVKLMYTLYNNLTNFSKKKVKLIVIVVFNNVNTVRSEMWVLVFPHHSCQKLVKSLVFDSWFDKIFWHLWCGKSHTHISSSQYSLIVQQFLYYSSF